VLHSAEFKALWDRIKHKTTYRVQFDNEKLIETASEGASDGPPITKTRLQWRKADIAIGKAGVEATEREGAPTVVLDEGDIELPDLLTDLQDRTQLTRRSIVAS
jgi:type III restriction enzyme